MSIEILSPVGKAETLDAALRAGADAVYFGLSSFNARRNAENFSEDDLFRAVRDCHRQNTKVYITLNTLISDDELPAAMSAVKLICRAGADGIIIDDLGLISLVRRCAPGLHLHASTQMTIHTPAALPILKEMGFTRVVAAREMTFDELEELCAAANALNMEVEVFVHGALCMCVSGQCYLSAFLGGRSGNRGLCAQPCRLPFGAENGTGNDLSLRDLSIIKYIGKLKEIGVASLKIEGRMKRPEYVAAATAACRNMLDNGDVPADLSTALSGVFSRSGFTAGYFENKTGLDMFGTRTDDNVKMSAEVLNSLHSLYRTERQCVALKARLNIENHRAELTLDDGENSAMSLCSAAESEKEISVEFLKSKLCKLGGTNYYIESLDFDGDMNCYLSAAQLGELRRNACAALDKMREIPREIEYTEPVYVNHASRAAAPFKMIARFDSAAQIPEKLSGIDAVILPLERDFNVAAIPAKTEYIVEIPRGIFGKDNYVSARLTEAKQHGIKYAMCHNLSAINLVNSAGMKIIGGFGLNLFNSESLAVAADFGAESAVISAELTCSQIESLNSEIPIGAFVYGHFPLMMTRNCPIKNGMSCEKCRRSSGLTDRKGKFFPVRCSLTCSEIYNSVPLWMADRKRELKTDFSVMYFTIENRAECEKIIKNYIDEKKPDGEFTRGLYYRGVE